MIYKEMNKMVKSSRKLKSAVLATTLGLFLATTSFVTTSNAATVKNGVACKKAGLKTKAGKKNYVCGKNPYVTPTKLTWMLSTCKQANDNYVDVKENYDFLSDLAKTNNYTSLQAMGDSLGGESKKDIDQLIQLVTATEVAMKNTLCKKGK
jgi:hypothetical protein